MTKRTKNPAKFSANTKFVVDFHNGIHSFIFTKSQIMNESVTLSNEMNSDLKKSLINLENARMKDFEEIGTCVSTNIVGSIVDSLGQHHWYTLNIGDNCINFKG